MIPLKEIIQLTYTKQSKIVKQKEVLDFSNELRRAGFTTKIETINKDKVRVTWY